MIADYGSGASSWYIEVWSWYHCISFLTQINQDFGLLVRMVWTGWIGCTDRMVLKNVREERPTVAIARLGSPLLDLEVRRVAGSGVCHHFHRCCMGSGLFLSVQKNNNITLHTNPNCERL